MAYNNSIVLATKFLPILDEVYKADSKTSVLDAGTSRVQFGDGATVKLFKTSMNGLGDYDRNAGYVTGSVTGTWEEHTLTQDRGRSFIIDSMDNEESLGMAFGTLASEFLRTRVTPEIDAYRFAKMAGTSGISTANADIVPGTTDVPALIQTADSTMSNNEVPLEGKILFISETAYAGLTDKIARFTMNGDGNINNQIEMYNGMRVIRVPSSRFNTAITMYDGTSSGETDGGYTVPASTSYPINFMIVHPSAVISVVKHAVPRIFSPDQVQTHDGWRFNYRLYHDIFVEENKKAGIYLHRASTANS